MSKTFHVTAIWDEEAGVWTSDSDVIGLHIEAETVEEFERLVQEHLGELIVDNHLTTGRYSPVRSMT